MANHERLTPCRSRDVAMILDMLVTGQPVAVVGLSNFGKSTLLRQMVEPAVAAAYRKITGRLALFLYVDCNRMLEMSAQGLYEVILRAVLDSLDIAPGQAQLRPRLEEYYNKVVEAKSSFTIPLAFNDAIITLLEDPNPCDVILLLDEFDAVLTGLDERVFLNFRALKDRYSDRLNFVTATLQPLLAVGGGDALSEFVEVFVAHRFHIKPLDRGDATELAAEIFAQNNDHLDPPERDYILAQAGGHPGLIQAVSHVVMEVESGAPASYTEQALSVAGDVLQNHQLVRSELGKLWKLLLPSEREAVLLVATRGVSALSEIQRMDLLNRGLLIENTHGSRLFGQLFNDYVRRKDLVQQDVPGGVWVDIDAGTVWLSGRLVEPLTDLEYRLLLLLYGRLDKICDKYQIVESVWGQEYLGEVDDARIEKLVSRLRAKLEPDPSNPRYVITVRGRGYKLARAQAELTPPGEAR